MSKTKADEQEQVVQNTTPRRAIRPHSEVEMRKALACSTGVKQHPDDDDPIEILTDMIDELLDLRAMRECIAQQTLRWQNALRRQ